MANRVVIPPVQVVAACGGRCALYTRHSPVKGFNQDAAAIVPHTRNSGAILVADGLGGLLAGEVAAEIAASSVRESILQLGSADRARAGALRTAILDGLERANERIMTDASGSATTIALVEIRGQSIRSYHVGDSMVLVCGLQGKLKHLTESHSPVGFAMKAGVLDEHEAMHHRKRHLVSNVIGSPDMLIETGPRLRLAARDTVLVATDGLFDNLHVSEIVERVRKGPLREAVERLAQDATERMLRPMPDQPSKPDDLTIIAFRRSR